MPDALTLTVSGSDYSIEYPIGIGGTVSHKNVMERKKSSDSVILKSLSGVVEQVQMQGIITQLSRDTTTPGISQWIDSYVRNTAWWVPTAVTLTYTETDLKNPQHSTTLTYNGCVKDFKWSKLEHDPGYLVIFTFMRHKTSGSETVRAIAADNNNLKVVQGGTTVYFQNVVQSSGSVGFGSMFQLPQRTTGKARVVNNLSASEGLIFKGETNSLAMIDNMINNLYVTNWWTASNVQLTYVDMYDNNDTLVRNVLLKSFNWEHSVNQRGVYKYTLEFGREK
jgi:hypothetical protein